MKITLSRAGETVIEDKKALDGEEIYAWKVENPVLWSAEDPQLYDLTMEIYNESGELQEVIPQKVGFRRFEMKDGIMTLNGKRIVFKGVNRHEFSSVSGRHVSEEELRKDLKIMKQNNINAIRTCHYPDASLIYQLCDEYGIYMIDETNLESHGSWDIAEFTKDYTYVVPHDKPEWLDGCGLRGPGDFGAVRLIRLLGGCPSRCCCKGLSASWPSLWAGRKPVLLPRRRKNQNYRIVFLFFIIMRQSRSPRCNPRISISAEARFVAQRAAMSFEGDMMTSE